MPEKRVLVTVPEPLRSGIVRKVALEDLRRVAEVETNDAGKNWTGAELAERLPGMDALIGSWGMPRLTDEVLAKADRLRIIAYAAGSVKGFVTDAVHARGIVVAHAAHRIADSVAEYTLLCALLGLRRVHESDRRLKAGESWPKSQDMAAFEIAGKRVGLLGMGYVGRRSARLFQSVGAQVQVFDPYLEDSEAASLCVAKAPLDRVLSESLVISVHLPVTDETHHMLGPRELSLIPDGAVLINSARSWTVDQDALVAELSTGRFWAALDVFDQEPLPVDHPLRRLENVLLTPHIAGLTQDSYRDLMSGMIDEVIRFFRGQPLLHRIDPERLRIMA